MISIRMIAAVTVALTGLGRRAAAPMIDRAATEGTVLSLLVQPDSARVDVVVGVRGDVTTKDFTLSGPDKIVVDISHASLGLARGQSYDHASRGGIVNVHYAQFKPGVVRVVVTLDAPHSYRVTRETAGIRISVEGSTSYLPAWAVGYVNASLAAISPPAAAKNLTRRNDEPSRPSAPKYTPRPSAGASGAAKSDAPMSGAAETAAMWVNGRRLAIAQVQSQQRRITINFEDTPIAEVLKIFSDYSGRSILASPSVKGTVSASISDVPWDVALKAILNLNGYDAVEDTQYGFITVNSFSSIHQQTAETARAEPMESRTIRFNYTTASAIEPMLRARLSRDCPTTTTSSAETTTPAAGGFANPNAPPTSVPVTAQQPAAPGTQTTIVSSGTCPTRGTVTSDTLTNSVSVTDLKANLDPLEAYAKTLDIRQPQVNIKAKIILVDRSSLEGLGMRYDLGSQTQFFNDLVPRLDSAGNPATAGQISLGGNMISAIANAGLRVPGAALQLAYSTALGAFDFTTFVEALQSTSLLDVQAEPNGTVLNNHTLELQAGTDVPIRTQEAGAGANSAGAVATVTVNVRTTGVILRVTPRVTNDNRVQMRIHVENSSVTFNGNDAVAFPKESVDNEVMLADGSTWVIGGLTQTTVTSTRTGIPLLIDLPIIGRLFGVTNRQEQKRDLLILITPHVVDPGQDAGSGH
jgi:type IV pilus assembly protein PilQ